MTNELIRHILSNRGNEKILSAYSHKILVGRDGKVESWEEFILADALEKNGKKDDD